MGRTIPRRMHPNRIGELRASAGMTLKQVGDACLPPAHDSEIQKLENSKMTLSQDWLYRLAPALGCRPCDLLPEAAESVPIEQIRALWQQLSDEERASLAGDAPPSAPSGPPPSPRRDDRVDPDSVVVKRGDPGAAGRPPLVEVSVNDQGSYRVVVYYRAPAGGADAGSPPRFKRGDKKD